MPSFADSIFLFVLALLLFGPKKLPVLARELGKWMGEFRRASNEFKMQMDEELRASEQADRQKQIAAMEAAAPVPPPLDEPVEPEHPHMRHHDPTAEPSLLAPEPAAESAELAGSHEGRHPDLFESRHPDLSEDHRPDISEDRHPERSEGSPYSSAAPTASSAAMPPASQTATADGVRPVPIATSGSLNMMPPATGLPTPRSSRSNALSGLVDAIPEAPGNTAPETESVAHGD